MKKIIEINDNNTFEKIKHIDEYGNEYWLARELQKVLEYKEWRNFKVVIDKAILSCENSNFNVSNHFVEFNKMIELGSKTSQTIKDYIMEKQQMIYLIEKS
jgi:DNA-damage-inducible protein D